MWKYVAGGIIIGSAAYGLGQYFSGGVCRCTTRLDGLVIVVTGANTGIGRALALLLAQRGATLVLACRDIQSGILAKKYILSRLSNKEIKIYVKELDLTSFASIIKFAESLNAEFTEIYALVNNAGIFFHRQCITRDGFDITMQTNYLGPVVLTILLLPLLKRSDHARIVNVSSEAHRNVNIHDLYSITKNQQMTYSLFIIYGVTKLALNLYTRALAKKVSNTNIIVNAADPGNVETKIFRYFPPLNNPFLYALQFPIRLLIIKNPSQGAQTILHALLTSNRSTGQYYQDCKLSLSSPLSLNDKVSIEYYELTMRLLREVLGTESDC